MNMFSDEMEQEETVDLEQSEFNAYVFDEMEFAQAAKMSNSVYYSRSLKSRTV